jgi:hypothetical protein
LIWWSIFHLLNCYAKFKQNHYLQDGLRQQNLNSVYCNGLFLHICYVFLNYCQ